ncbi:MAG TPA: hypothetical protein DCL61_01625 [Cyanobacteria bacterium UBA12227]|nr:hypothetical protein [Cyanobacteria bacterium UBA12227]HAX88308.1 hypothetical protein [Cyanobacteria bacterium UBA11370]HBY78271.1 hypothetical protein [Cyanobacteria bacterium UBA11148]
MIVSDSGIRGSDGATIIIGDNTPKFIAPIGVSNGNILENQFFIQDMGVSSLFNSSSNRAALA